MLSLEGLSNSYQYQYQQKNVRIQRRYPGTIGNSYRPQPWLFVEITFRESESLVRESTDARRVPPVRLSIIPHAYLVIRRTTH